MKTKDRLAKVLSDAGLNQDDTHGQGKGLLQMSVKASQGYYDDFESPLPMPIHQLVIDLRRVGREDLAERAKNGEWDGSKEESEEWYQREGKDLLKGLK